MKRLLFIPILLVLLACGLVLADEGDIWAVNVQGSDVMRLTGSGHLVPGVTNAYDIGSSSLVYRNVYTTGFTANGNVIMGDAHADTVTVRGSATVADLDGGDGASFQKLTARVNVRQSSGTGTNNTGYLLIEDGETVSDWTATTNVTRSADTAHFRNGTSSLKLAFTAAAVAGNGASWTISNGNWSGNENVGFWIYTDTALASGDLRLTITDGTQGASTVNVGAVSSTGVWTFVLVDISGVADGNKDDVDGFSIDLTTQGATSLAAFNVYFDTVIKWDNSGQATLAGTVLDGGMIGAVTVPTASGTNNTLTTLAEGTDFWVRPGATGRIIFATDQSANQFLATYCTQ